MCSVPSADFSHSMLRHDIYLRIAFFCHSNKLPAIFGQMNNYMTTKLKLIQLRISSDVLIVNLSDNIVIMHFPSKSSIYFPQIIEKQFIRFLVYLKVSLRLTSPLLDLCLWGHVISLTHLVHAQQLVTTSINSMHLHEGIKFGHFFQIYTLHSSKLGLIVNKFC